MAEADAEQRLAAIDQRAHRLPFVRRVHLGLVRGATQRGAHDADLATRLRRARLGGERTLEEFTEIMANLNLPYPKFIDYAVPGNKQCGVCPADLPENLEKYCQQMTESAQG